ncbi:MAG: response regulator transcription factor [Lachnospiraceae bacterium]|nr:response regulator transcription factor [Lachnospiraceae bacterium]
MTEANGGAKFHILIVEDDLALAGGLCRALGNEETETVSCHTLREATKLLETGNCQSGAEKEKDRDGVAGTTGRADFDLVLLDVNLPDGNGFDYLQEIKRKYDIFVIMLTANDMETDIVTGLELGADDYITKPFSLAVLRARVAIQLRRVEAQEHGKMADSLTAAGECGQRTGNAATGSMEMPQPAKDEGWIVDEDYRFHFAKMLFYRGEEQMELSKSEQKLLRFLIENRGITLSRDKLLECIWSVDAEFVDENTLSVTVKRLRDKLGAQNKIKTVYGIGYRWE